MASSLDLTSCACTQLTVLQAIQQLVSKDLPRLKLKCTSCTVWVHRNMFFWEHECIFALGTASPVTLLPADQGSNAGGLLHLLCTHQHVVCDAAYLVSIRVGLHDNQFDPVVGPLELLWWNAGHVDCEELSSCILYALISPGLRFHKKEPFGGYSI